jgi:hypothetical protein
MKTIWETRQSVLEAMYPKAWFKLGEEFGSGHVNSLWSGEGSEMYDEEYEFDVPLFNYYGYQDTLGINPKFLNTLQDMGLWAEFYDAGTVFIYEL